MSVESIKDILEFPSILMQHNFDIEITNYDDEEETELCKMVSRVYESGRKVVINFVIPETSGELFLRNILNSANNIKTIKVSHKDTKKNSIFSTLYKVSKFIDWDIESAACDNNDDNNSWSKEWGVARPLEISLDFETTPSVPVEQPLEGVKKWVDELGRLK